MNQSRIVVAGVVLLAGLLSSCAASVSDAYVIKNDPGSVKLVAGTEHGVVSLTEAAVNRLQIQTARVTRAGKALVVPSDAVFVDSDGAWWLFTNPEPQKYVRVKIEIRREADGKAFLAAGPKVGTEVVIVGAAELSGVEQAVGH
ncbi:MAG TPA: hypothetical protein VLI04_01265 [Nocardioidaceae bacterium]|nr:hypothetical protein [Nocardioidaceae bacterium]